MLWSTLLPDRLRVSKKHPESPITGISYRLRERYRRLLLAEKISCERRALSKLSDRQLRDIGIQRADVDDEVRRRFWNLPENRL